MLTMFTPSSFRLDYPSAKCMLINSLAELPPQLPSDCLLAADITVSDAEDALQILSENLGPRLLVAEVWQEVLPQADLLISAAISGGNLAQRMREVSAANPGRCWLLIKPLRMRITLPSPTGQGVPLTAPELEEILFDKPSFYSPELCCQYCYDLPSSVVLYDTAKTIQQKRQLAEEVGFRGALIPAL